MAASITTHSQIALVQTKLFVYNVGAQRPVRCSPDYDYRMEIGVRFVGVVLRLLNLLLSPLWWALNRGRHRSLPPLANPLLFDSGSTLARKIRNGEVTSEQIVAAYIERIKEVNPYLNAVVEERFEAALQDARDVDKKLTEAKKIGRVEELTQNSPLLGVPFTVKESCSLEGLSNSVGCLNLAGRRATEDGAAVRRVRAAGAIPLLVSNTPELCLGWETSNLLHGTTNNPYCLTRSPGGSSGGEAALLASGASPLSVSSDIAGSIRVPAAFCGVFGHKPTPGTVQLTKLCRFELPANDGMRRFSAPHLPPSPVLSILRHCDAYVPNFVPYTVYDVLIFEVELPGRLSQFR
ncbi:Fatty-acid amide hydrolase 2 [Eumeta japonica]|uniref:Fatty-acid amide hydrolase 2 n=1 Tax=Eumeta variegata TaxID=151549 RepID=A0A4C1YQP7_EUMVA|nr:Fatty-acid amide hydrolase 2 [Eumeta japonica]